MITIVSGLPRSGTSLMMQMLDAGGLPVLSDGERKADTDNPRGYLEWERIKKLPKNPGLIAEAEGKVVKVISQLILSLPSDHEYSIVFMQRPLPEVLKSQDEMLRRRGNSDLVADNSAMEEFFHRHLIEVNQWLARHANMKVVARALSSSAPRTQGSCRGSSRIFRNAARHRCHGRASGWKLLSQPHEVGASQREGLRNKMNSERKILCDCRAAYRGIMSLVEILNSAARPRSPWSARMGARNPILLRRGQVVVPSVS